MERAVLAAVAKLEAPAGSTAVAKSLGMTHTGGVCRAMERMAQRGQIVRVADQPRRYAKAA